MLTKLLNRWSYIRNNSQFTNRHWPLLKSFIDVPSPGMLKANWALHVVKHNLANLCRRGST